MKGAKLVSLLLETFRSGIDKPSKLRLLAVFITSQRDASTEDKRVLVQVRCRFQGIVPGPSFGLSGAAFFSFIYLSFILVFFVCTPCSSLHIFIINLFR